MSKEYQQAVKRVAWSIILSTYHVNIVVFDILPDWLGYLWLFSAIEKIGEYQPSAKLLKPFVTVVTINSVIETALKLFGKSINIYIYQLIIAIIYIYLYYQLLTDIWHIIQEKAISGGNKIPLLRDITTFTFTLTFVFSSMGDNMYAIYTVGIINIIAKTWLAFHLFNHSESLQNLNT